MTSLGRRPGLLSRPATCRTIRDVRRGLLPSGTCETASVATPSPWDVHARDEPGGAGLGRAHGQGVRRRRVLDGRSIRCPAIAPAPPPVGAETQEEHPAAAKRIAPTGVARPRHRVGGIACSCSRTRPPKIPTQRALRHPGERNPPAACRCSRQVSRSADEASCFGRHLSEVTAFWHRIGRAAGCRHRIGRTAGIRGRVGHAPGCRHRIGRTAGIRGRVGRAAGCRHRIGRTAGIRGRVGHAPGCRHRIGRTAGIRGRVGHAAGADPGVVAGLVWATSISLP